MFVPMQHAQITPRAEELARRINEVITSFQSTHPDLSGAELQQALMRAAMTAGPGGSGGSSQRAVVVAAGVGLVALLGVTLLVAERDGGGDKPWPVIAILVAVLAIVAAILAIRRSSS